MRDIKGYEGLYAVTSCGKVWSHRSQKFLKSADNGHGYQVVVFSTDKVKNKHYRVHRLVAEAYIDNPNGYSEVNHKDGNRSNNNINNLEWVSKVQNCNMPSSKRNHPKKRYKILCVETGVIYKSQAEASRATGVGQYNISSCITGKQKTAGGYHWEHAE